MKDLASVSHSLPLIECTKEPLGTVGVRFYSKSNQTPVYSCIETTSSGLKPNPE